jgi:hypothetical protein
MVVWWSSGKLLTLSGGRAQSAGAPRGRRTPRGHPRDCAAAAAPPLGAPSGLSQGDGQAAAERIIGAGQTPNPQMQPTSAKRLSAVCNTAPLTRSGT